MLKLRLRIRIWQTSPLLAWLPFQKLFHPHPTPPTLDRPTRQSTKTATSGALLRREFRLSEGLAPHARNAKAQRSAKDLGTPQADLESSAGLLVLSDGTRFLSKLRSAANKCFSFNITPKETQLKVATKRRAEQGNARAKRRRHEGWVAEAC